MSRDCAKVNEFCVLPTAKVYGPLFHADRTTPGDTYPDRQNVRYNFEEIQAMI
jgi:hypothetical protein